MNRRGRPLSLLSCGGGIARRTILAQVCLCVCLTTCHRQTDLAQGQKLPILDVKSSDFANGGNIPPRFTCDGADVSPNLQWSAPPAGTKSLALVMHDPDALIDFTHWVIYSIPSGSRSLANNATQQSTMPDGSAEGVNDFGRSGYGGPCPPGSKPHRYVFHLYALDMRLDLPAGAARKELNTAIRGHILAEGQIMGTYRRTGQ